MYTVGAKLIQRDDDMICAEIVGAKPLNGIEHYHIVFHRDCVRLEPIWLSGAGVERQFRLRQPTSARPEARRWPALFGRLAASA